MTILKELWTEEFDEAEVKTSYQYVIDLREKLEQALKLACEELKRSQARYQRYYNWNAKDRKFVVGDKVLNLLPTDKNKLLMQWKGPFEVEKIVGTNDYGIQVGGKVKTFHANTLKKYIERKNADDVNNRKQELDGGDDGDNKGDSVGRPVLHLTAASIIETSIGGSNGAVDDEELLELGLTAPKEIAADVVLGERLTEEQRVQLEELIDRYEHIFTDVPGDSNLTEHQIEATSEEPIRSKPYAIPYNVRESLKEEIQAMLQMGVIRESKSPYASPVVVVRKKDGTNRVCVDYRKLNRLTVSDPAPGNTAEEIFQKIAKKKYFTRTDLSKVYLQIPVAEKDVAKTAFVTPDGTYEFIRMPFGMVNSGATLARGMRKLIDDLDDVENYVDDIIVHTETWEGHLVALDELFHRLSEAKLTARPTKCVMGTKAIQVIGHRVSEGIKGLQEENVRKIEGATRPKTMKQVRAFIGLTGYYRDFIPNYAAKAAPLTDLTKKVQPNKVSWEQPKEKAFVTLKKNSRVNLSFTSLIQPSRLC